MKHSYDLQSTSQLSNRQQTKYSHRSFLKQLYSQPLQLSSRKINPKIQFKLNRLNDNKQASVLFKKVFAEVGSPNNRFVKRRIKDFSWNFTHALHRKFDKRQNQKINEQFTQSVSFDHQNQQSSPSNIYKLNSIRENNHQNSRLIIRNKSVDYTQKMKKNNTLNNQQQSKYTSRKSTYQRAHVLCESQKLQRLIQLNEQKKKQYENMSKVIKLRLQKRPEKLVLDSPSPINQKTWYQKWKKAVTNSTLQKNKKVNFRLKTSQAKRNHTQQIHSLRFKTNEEESPSKYTAKLII